MKWEKVKKQEKTLNKKEMFLLGKDADGRRTWLVEKEGRWQVYREDIGYSYLINFRMWIYGKFDGEPLLQATTFSQKEGEKLIHLIEICRYSQRLLKNFQKIPFFLQYENVLQVIYSVASATIKFLLSEEGK